VNNQCRTFLLKGGGLYTYQDGTPWGSVPAEVQEQILVAQRIMARSTTETPCLVYARLYWRWVRSPAKEQPARLDDLRAHLAYHGCRTGKGVDESWIFGGENK
jgi:hypothetical protein